MGSSRGMFGRGRSQRRRGGGIKTISDLSVGGGGGGGAPKYPLSDFTAAVTEERTDGRGATTKLESQFQIPRLM